VDGVTIYSQVSRGWPGLKSSYANNCQQDHQKRTPEDRGAFTEELNPTIAWDLAVDDQCNLLRCHPGGQLSQQHQEARLVFSHSSPPFFH
jgi:hypothetical protein